MEILTNSRILKKDLKTRLSELFTEWQGNKLNKIDWFVASNLNYCVFAVLKILGSLSYKGGAVEFV